MIIVGTICLFVRSFVFVVVVVVVVLLVLPPPQRLCQLFAQIPVSVLRKNMAAARTIMTNNNEDGTTTTA